MYKLSKRRNKKRKKKVNKCIWLERANKKLVKPKPVYFGHKESKIAYILEQVN